MSRLGRMCVSICLAAAVMSPLTGTCRPSAAMSVSAGEWGAGRDDRQTDRQRGRIGWLAAQRNRCVGWRWPSVCHSVACDVCSRECVDLSSMHPSHTAGSQTDRQTDTHTQIACLRERDLVCVSSPSVWHLAHRPSTPERQPTKGVGALGLPGGDRDAPEGGARE